MAQLELSFGKPCARVAAGFARVCGDSHTPVCSRFPVTSMLQFLVQPTAERSAGLMRNRSLCFILVFVLGGALYPSAVAQDQGSARGNLSGLVYDSTKAVVPGA